MNIKSISLSVFFSLALFSKFALAQIPSREGPGRGGSGNHPVLRALDINGDGSISSKEIEEASESLLSLDENTDGIISGNELRPNRFGRGPRSDTNGRRKEWGYPWPGRTEAKNWRTEAK